MPDTLTPNYGWVLPQIAGDASTWGATINSDLNLIDAQVFNNENAGVGVGFITMFGGATPPANWLLCNGQSLATTGAYAALFAVLGYTYGGAGPNFNLPNLQANFAIGAGAGISLGATGGANSTVISAAQMPAHTHTITQVAHAHTATQPAHVHPDPGHTHGVSDPTHAHTGSVAISTGYGIGPNFPSPIVAGGATGVTINAAATGIAIQGAGTGLQAAGADAVTVAATTPTGPTATGSVGSGNPVPTVPPFVAINFIIRFA